MSGVLETALTLLAIPAMFVAAALNIVAFSVLWGWFIVPLGAPSISFAHAFGIILTINLLMRARATTRDVEKIKEGKTTIASIWRPIGESVAASIFVICIGWLVLQIWGI